MKAILVIDMPKNCGECKFLSATQCGKEMCVATSTRREWIEDETIKPSWCPLKPIPQKKELKGGWYHPSEVWMEGANFGWNACIDALGETE